MAYCLLNLPRFVIVCAGFRTPLPTNPELGWWRAAGVGPEGAPLATPALFVVGERDVVTPPSQTRQLAALFADATVHEVRGGQHAMPQKAADRPREAPFLAGVHAALIPQTQLGRSAPPSHKAAPAPTYDDDLGGSDLWDFSSGAIARKGRGGSRVEFDLSTALPRIRSPYNTGPANGHGR